MLGINKIMHTSKIKGFKEKNYLAEQKNTGACPSSSSLCVYVLLTFSTKVLGGALRGISGSMFSMCWGGISNWALSADVKYGSDGFRRIGIGQCLNTM